MGKGQLVQRLSAQLKEQGMKDPEGAARAILIARGHMTPDGQLTPAGAKRDAMTAEERAKDRASRYTGKPKTAFSYNPKTNRTKVR